MAFQGNGTSGGAVSYMRVALRVDASLQIGTGHVMRCLTLAEALSASGADCEFICRAHEGNLIDFIRSKGYTTNVLPVLKTLPRATDSVHVHWLGATQAQDAEACVPILAAQRVDWLIVDHYALDARWERALAPYRCKLMVIDDLADRSHACDLLLDQTVGRDATDYHPLVPATCRLLCGSQYALLRPEFAALRHNSLRRRERPVLRNLLVTMGGVDKDNATGQVLQALRTCPLPADCRITVAMLATAPWLAEVRIQAQDMPWPTRVLVDVKKMAKLMADCDLAIGAAGGTSWERCCLGVPTIMFVLAENQRSIARNLERLGTAKLIDFVADASRALKPMLTLLIADTAELARMSECGARIVDGYGVNAVMEQMVA